MRPLHHQVIQLHCFINHSLCNFIFNTLKQATLRLYNELQIIKELTKRLNALHQIPYTFLPTCNSEMVCFVAAHRTSLPVSASAFTSQSRAIDYTSSKTLGHYLRTQTSSVERRFALGVLSCLNSYYKAVHQALMLHDAQAELMRAARTLHRALRRIGQRLLLLNSLRITTSRLT
eukprot:IDg14791t1